MRILVVCSDTGVRIGAGKGAALHLQAIMSAFAELGHETEVVGVAASAAAPWGVRAHLVAHPGRAEGELRERRKRDVVEQVAALGLRVADRLRPHLVYERLSLFGTAGLRVARRCGARHVVEVNALLAREEATWRGLHDGVAADAAEAEVLRGADLRVAVSAEIALAVGPMAGGGPVLVVPNGVDVGLFGQRRDPVLARAELGLPAAARLVCFTGSLRPWHGLEVAVDSLTRLPPDVHLVVAGDGPVRLELARRAHDLGVDHRIHWLGHLPHQRIPAVLAACDVAVAPYPDLPGFAFSPLKLYEYLAAGTPIVASAVGQITEALDGGRWGRLAAAGDPGALAAAVLAVLTDPGSPARAAGARTHALAHHGWTHRAQQVLAATDHLELGDRDAVAM